jgi:uncharacterized protein YecT (DUF1311 family)
MSTSPRIRPLLLLFVALCSAASTITAAPWPEDYVVAENSQSSDGQYGVLIPKRDSAAAGEDQSVNYLANLKTRQTLGPIRDCHYSEGRNHQGLEAYWAPDSSWGVVEYDARFGFASLAILELEGDGFTQTEIGGNIQRSLNAVIAKSIHEAEAACDVSGYFRLSADRKLKVRGLGTTNPRQLDTVKSLFALFQGTYDLNGKRWKVTDSSMINMEESEALESAYGPASQGDMTFPTLAAKAKYLDDQLNAVYKAVRFILPARFAEIKQDQLAWLKERDGAGSDAEKCKLIDARIKVLQDFLW